RISCPPQTVPTPSVPASSFRPHSHPVRQLRHTPVHLKRERHIPWEIEVSLPIFNSTQDGAGHIVCRLSYIRAHGTRFHEGGGHIRLDVAGEDTHDVDA